MHQSRRVSWHHSAHNPRRVSPVCILGVYPRCVSPVCILGVHPGVHPSFIRHPIRSTSSVDSYLRSYLTADSRTSPVPAISHFYSLFITFIYRCSRDLLLHRVFIHTVCLLRYSVSLTIHRAIMHQSGDHPRRPSPVCILACIRHPILSIIFGTILPSVLSYRGF
jgi:hypothetical protein